MSSDAAKEIERIMAAPLPATATGVQRFGVLGLTSADQIKASTSQSLRSLYKKLSLLTHPDKCSDIADAASAFNKVETAYKALQPDAVLQRAIKGALVQLAAAPGVPAPAGDARGAAEAERAAAAREEDYRRALRMQEESDRRRQRDEDDAVERERLRAAIDAERDEWRAALGAAGAGRK
jgi:curved DNA-binding protein CbpA